MSYAGAPFEQRQKEKLLYTVGNLYSGNPWAVEGQRQFDTVDLYGPFSTGTEANHFAAKLTENPAPDGMPYKAVRVVRIETPTA